ncbi:hypothetical protein, partial [Haematobacter genomosp. 1]|uniref:hypothetical protein n=1 Tax=Haematobacter genomosp. 1 TaxID=366618 RepID=UPI001C52DB1F
AIFRGALENVRVNQITVGSRRGIMAMLREDRKRTVRRTASSRKLSLNSYNNGKFLVLSVGFMLPYTLGPKKI